MYRAQPPHLHRQPWTRRSPLLLLAFLCAPAPGHAAPPGSLPAAAPVPTKEPRPPWLAEELPLPLLVRTQADLGLKGAIEKQYLVFNLLAGGKAAWDAGKFGVAADKWEAVLRLPHRDLELETVLLPFAIAARARAGGAVTATPPDAPTRPEDAPSRADAAEMKITIRGKILGGGNIGPGGTVVWLKRTDGKTPTPTPGRGKVIRQINKTFLPHVLPVTVGTKVEFKNQDDIFHNVFSLSRPNDFDAGLYKGGNSYTRTFDTAGPVQMLCNIHASMLGYVVVVDSPYFGQADSAGAFSIKGVPPGQYETQAWHEGSSGIPTVKIAVVGGNAPPLVIRVAGDQRRPTLVPDKYGKPRQAHLGY